MYDDVEDTDEEPDVDDIEVNAEVGYTIKCACTQMLKGECQKIYDLRFFDESSSPGHKLSPSVISIFCTPAVN